MYQDMNCFICKTMRCNLEKLTNDNYKTIIKISMVKWDNVKISGGKCALMVLEKILGNRNKSCLMELQKKSKGENHEERKN